MPRKVCVDSAEGEKVDDQRKVNVFVETFQRLFTKWNLCSAVVGRNFSKFWFKDSTTLHCLLNTQCVRLTCSWVKTFCFFFLFRKKPLFSKSILTRFFFIKGAKKIWYIPYKYINFDISKTLLDQKILDFFFMSYILTFCCEFSSHWLFLFGLSFGCTHTPMKREQRQQMTVTSLPF